MHNHIPRNLQPIMRELFDISNCVSLWNELKHVLIDKKIKITTRIRFLEACVRSRLLYSVQTWDLKAHENLKLETIGFLCKMVTNGLRLFCVTALSRRLSGLINSIDHTCNKGDFALVQDL